MCELFEKKGQASGSDTFTHWMMLWSDATLRPLTSSTRNTPKLYTSLCMEKFVDSFVLVNQESSIKLKKLVDTIAHNTLKIDVFSMYLSDEVGECKGFSAK
jgi:hypothetical protein